MTALVALAVLSAASCSSPATVQASDSAFQPAGVVSFTVRHMSMRVTLGCRTSTGTRRLTFFVDTGAPCTEIRAQVARELGLADHGSITLGSRPWARTVQPTIADSLVLPPYLARTQPGAPPLDGVLGLDFFRSGPFGIDFGAKIIALWPAGSDTGQLAQWWFSHSFIAARRSPIRWLTSGATVYIPEPTGTRQLEITSPFEPAVAFAGLEAQDDEFIWIPGSIDGSERPLMVDTGSLATSVSELGRGHTVPARIWFDGRVVPGAVSKVHRLQIAGLTFPEPISLAVVPAADASIVGFDQLRQLKLLISIEQRCAFLAPRIDPKPRHTSWAVQKGNGKTRPNRK